ncbi:phage terminase large subunit family protein [Ferviditalea candida]|uniref:Phage terminase large subunit family protein n=1 Tax=Ferviditalea candida TaxID=3108399 RepID=A0ABU5ZKP1_9BACL|nr:phage terminase large subunit family protein [Paenibacillaceae bacterium T2]
MRRPNKTFRLFREIAKTVAPPPKYTVSQWADAKRRLSSEASAEPGQWRTDRAPYQRGIMDAINDPNAETIVVESSAQVGKTEVLLNIIGYHVDYDPAPIMLVQPTLELAQAFSKDRLAPMLRDSPALRGKVKDVKSKDSGNTMLHKIFPGGHITMAGANSPASLASRPIQILLLDEVDRYPVSAGTEGDPVSLVTKRTTTFWNRKIVKVSTPTIKGASRIEEDYENSTMEQWCLPCPSCGEHQPLRWPQVKFTYDKDSKECTSAEHACRSCGALHSEREWKSGSGKWVARKQSRKVRGFHLNELASPWKRWETIVEEFHEAKIGGPEKLKVWINTSLGETWEEKGDGVESEDLVNRREFYQAEVPSPVLVLTCGVDVQDNRLEYEVVGWGLEKQSWGIQYGVIMGDPGQGFVWEQLDHVINKEYVAGDGQKLQIMTTCVDSGGHFTEQVYTYCKERELKRVWAIKGKGGSGLPFIMRPKRRNDDGVWLFIIGVDVGKDTLSSRLKVKSAELPEFCHFPSNPDRHYDEEYFAGLTAEHRVMRKVMGKPVFHWVQKPGSGRNEPLDLRNYATAAFEILSPPLEILQRMRFDSGSSGSRPVPKEPKKRSGVVNKGISL